MSVDIAVCFTTTPVNVNHIGHTAALAAAQVSELYLVHGDVQHMPRPTYFFALWSDRLCNLQTIVAEVSMMVSPIYIAWKVEHGGVGGYVAYTHGQLVQDVAAQDGRYLPLFAQGFHDTFGFDLNLSADDVPFFPELYLDDAATCRHMTVHPYTRSIRSAATITALLEGQCDVEPVFPLDLEGE